jgi:uncharacterized membrane protein YeiH
MLLTLLDLVGTFVFALSGGLRGVERRLDPFGIVFLAFVAAVSGGVLRDLLIGATPPAAMQSWHYAAVSTLAGALCFFAYGSIVKLVTPIAVFDALGLGLFAVVGARKALDAGLSPLMAALLGMLTAIGGGMVRDIVTARTPMVLRREIYALAALAGAAVLAFGDFAGAPDIVTAPIGAALTTGLRLIALRLNWNLPRARSR